MWTAVVLAVILAAGPVAADVYMHNPRGSNDRNCERNVNRNNGNRLFDSQNNAKGGYACPRPVGGPEVQRLVPAEDNVFGNTLTGQRFWEKMYYYVNSKLPIEWTAQHGCGGNKKTNCQIILQYACEDTLDPYLEFTAPLGTNDRWIGAPRDGIPRDSDDAATDTIPANYENGIANTEENRRFGMHENQVYYKNCTQRSRNRGLFTADQNVQRNDARGTRQNPNGNRNGLECPEERDYYPYWHPSPWIDIAVLHDFSDSNAVSTAWCNYYRTNSQNTASSTAGECVPNYNSPVETPAQIANRMNNGQWWNNRKDCEARNHTFNIRPLGLSPTNPLFAKLTMPDCQVGQLSRINHLGNAAGTSYDDASDAVNIPHDLNAARYVWTIPDHVNENCVLRMRYNISTSDYPAWRYDPNNPSAVPAGTPGINSTLNGRDNSPVTQDPYIYVGKGDDQFLSLAVNTNQYGRTFQDRSYVFAIRRPNAAVQTAINNNKKLYNLNVRGKRGNIVQTYPAVEYDFVPDDINAQSGDMIHFQWTGSDYNPRRGCNDAEGGPPDPNTATAANDNSRADRSNIVPIDVFSDNYPSHVMYPQWVKTTRTDPTARPNLNATLSMFTDTDTMLLMAFIKQDRFLSATAPCLTQTELNQLNNDQVRENHPRNCGKLNAAFTPYFDGGVRTMTKVGTWGYFSSRNNNFSNRDQTGRVCVYANAGSSSTCTGVASTGATRVVKALVPPSTAQANIITQETFAFNTAENDALGDGERQACQGLNYSLSSMSESSAVGLALGMLVLGCVLVLGTQFGLRWYVGAPRGFDDLCCGGEGKVGMKKAALASAMVAGAASTSPVAASASSAAATGASKTAPPPPTRHRPAEPVSHAHAAPPPAYPGAVHEDPASPYAPLSPPPPPPVKPTQNPVAAAAGVGAGVGVAPPPPANKPALPSRNRAPPPVPHA